MDVRLGFRNVADGEFLAGGGHHLHHADGTHRALGSLIELRLLVALGGHQQPVHIVLVPVLLEVLNQSEELLAFGLRGRILHVLGVLQVTRQDRVAYRAPFRMAAKEVVDRRLQLRAILADGPGDVGAGPDCDLVMHRHLGEDLLPEVGLVLVHDD